MTANEVRVFKRGETPPQPYEILGTLGSAARGKGMKYVPEKKARNLMRVEAAALGANALVGFFADDDRTHSSAWWAAALAVQMPPAADAPPVDREPIVVAVPLAVFDAARTSETAASLQRICQRFAEYRLIEKGYYPRSLDCTLELTVSELKAMPEAELKACGGPEADFILLLNHTTTSRRYYLIGIRDSRAWASLWSEEARSWRRRLALARQGQTRALSPFPRTSPCRCRRHTHPRVDRRLRFQSGRAAVGRPTD